MNVTSVCKVPTPTPDSNGGSKNGLSLILTDVLIGLRPSFNLLCVLDLFLFCFLMFCFVLI